MQEQSADPEVVTRLRGEIADLMKAVRLDTIEECAQVVQAKLDDHDPQLAEYAATVIRGLKSNTTG